MDGSSPLTLDRRPVPGSVASRGARCKPAIASARPLTTPSTCRTITALPEAAIEMSQAAALETRTRLRSIAHERGALFERVLHQFAHERLLARLRATLWGRELVLRGAAAIAARLGVPHRRIRRLELANVGSDNSDRAVGAFRAVSGYGQGALTYEPDSFHARLVTPASPVQELRIRQFATLVKARIPVEVSVSFIDSVVPAPEVLALPTLLDFNPVEMRVVQFETIAAECLVEIVTRPRVRRRMTDYFDLWMCMQVDPLEGLEEAVRVAFEARRGEVPVGIPDGLSDGYAASEHARGVWDVFMARGEVEAQVKLEAVVEEIRERVRPTFE